MSKKRQQTKKTAAQPVTQPSFATSAFGRDTLRYRAFIQALVDGQHAYDQQMNRGRSHAQATLSVA